MVQKVDINIEKIFDDIADIEADDNTLELLTNGVAAYIKEPNMPQGTMIKLYPDGKKEIVNIDKSFCESIVSA